MMKGLKKLMLSACRAIALAAVVVSTGNIAHAKPVPLDRIVAVVDKDVVMESELNHRVEAVQRQLSERNITLPPESVLKNQVLEQLVLENLQLQMGRNGGIRIDDWDAERRRHPNCSAQRPEH